MLSRPRTAGGRDAKAASIRDANLYSRTGISESRASEFCDVLEIFRPCPLFLLAEKKNYSARKRCFLGNVAQHGRMGNFYGTNPLQAKHSIVPIVMIVRPLASQVMEFNRLA